MQLFILCLAHFPSPFCLYKQSSAERERERETVSERRGTLLCRSHGLLRLDEWPALLVAKNKKKQKNKKEEERRLCNFFRRRRIWMANSQ